MDEWNEREESNVHYLKFNGPKSDKTLDFNPPINKPSHLKKFGRDHKKNHNSFHRAVVLGPSLGRVWEAYPILSS